jgi:hypothetical protein
VLGRREHSPRRDHLLGRRRTGLCTLTNVMSSSRRSKPGPRCWSLPTETCAPASGAALGRGGALPRSRDSATGTARDRGTRIVGSAASGFRRAGLCPAGKPEAVQAPDHKKDLPPTVPCSTSGGRSFAEPISLSSTVPVDFRLPATALEIGFDLLASRTRRRRDITGGLGEIQGGSRPEMSEVLALCKLFFFPHFHSHPCNCG